MKHRKIEKKTLAAVKFGQKLYENVMFIQKLQYVKKFLNKTKNFISLLVSLIIFK